MHTFIYYLFDSYRGHRILLNKQILLIKHFFSVYIYKYVYVYLKLKSTVYQKFIIKTNIH